MSYRTETIREVAVEGVPCGWTYGRGGCKGDHGKPSVAVHVLLKNLPVAPKDTPLCAYHSPFDVEVETMIVHKIPATAAEAKALATTLVGRTVTLRLFVPDGPERTAVLRSFDRRSGAGLAGNCETIRIPFRDIVGITTEG